MSVEFIGDDGDLSEILNKLRSEEASEHWEQLTNEKTIRRMDWNKKTEISPLYPLHVIGMQLIQKLQNQKYNARMYG
jgi:hypothetical protein